MAEREAEDDDDVVGVGATEATRVVMAVGCLCVIDYNI